jgi:AraC family transcriptional regulator
MQKNMNICQSCGMSLTKPEHFGSNRDGSPHTDYCCHCFRNGRFIRQDTTLTEKVEPFIRRLNRTENRHTSAKKESTFQMWAQPASKRWQSSETTHREYFKAINTAISFINEHLHERINLRDLAEAVHISGFHFHRIFKATLGECPGRYIQRLRMEKAAFSLKTTNQTLTEIAEQTGYQSPQALSKAFRKYYGITPSEFRMRPQDFGINMNSINS